MTQTKNQNHDRHDDRIRSRAQAVTISNMCFNHWKCLTSQLLVPSVFSCWVRRFDGEQGWTRATGRRGGTKSVLAMQWAGSRFAHHFFCCSMLHGYTVYYKCWPCFYLSPRRVSEHVCRRSACRRHDQQLFGVKGASFWLFTLHNWGLQVQKVLQLRSQNTLGTKWGTWDCHVSDVHRCDAQAFAVWNVTLNIQQCKHSQLTVNYITSQSKLS